MTEPARMRDRMRCREVPDAVILVPFCDTAAAEALGLPVDIVVFDGAEFLWRGDGVAEDRMHLATLGVVALSAEGARDVAGLAAFWARLFGSELPGFLDLSRVAAGARREAALEWLTDVLLAERQGAAGRMVSLMRAMAALRQEHEAMQASFARLETHAFLHRLSQRKLGFTVTPAAGSPVLELPSGAALVQRVPGLSVGLSDIALRISEGPARSGVLRCRLESPDRGEVLAEWSVPAARIEAGWLRLSLLRGLEADPVGLEIRLEWEGAGPLRLETAMAHPDPRFLPCGADGMPVGRHVLAIEVWHYLPGVRAPGSAKGLLPDGSGEADLPTRRIDGIELLRAINLDTLVQDMQTVHGAPALLVHVMPDRVTCGILPETVGGARVVSADIMTWSAKGPLVDYAIGVLPAGLRPRQPGVLPEFPEGFHSGWVRMKPMRAGQVTLILPDLPGDAHDLYLMTRLPPGTTSNAWGWSGFSGVVMHV